MRSSDWSSDVCSSDLERASVHRGVEVGAQLLAQHVNGDQLALDVEVPEGPAVAGRSALQMGAELVDRAFEVRGDERAIGAHLGAPALVRAVQHGARHQTAVLAQPAERKERLAALGWRMATPPVGDRLSRKSCE